MQGICKYCGAYAIYSLVVINIELKDQPYISINICKECFNNRLADRRLIQ